jgi:hypothetical protein
MPEGNHTNPVIEDSMKAKTILFAAPIVLLGCVVAALMVFRPPASERKNSAPRVELAATTISEPVPVEEPGPAEPVATPDTAAPPVKASAPASPAAAPGPKPKEERQDPLAREAMALVGVDPEAEAYWFEAINDPSLSDSEREDLIEDLNESGFSDGNGRRPTVDDLPIIDNRLDLLIQLRSFGPFNDVRDPSIDEAINDLLKIHNQFRGK